MKSVTITDFLTAGEIKKCIAMWERDRGNFHQRVLDEIVKPNMARINEKLGQDNVPGFIAYAIEYALMQSEERK